MSIRVAPRTYPDVVLHAAAIRTRLPLPRLRCRPPRPFTRDPATVAQSGCASAIFEDGAQGAVADAVLPRWSCPTSTAAIAPSAANVDGGLRLFAASSHLPTRASLLA